MGRLVTKIRQSFLSSVTAELELADGKGEQLLLEHADEFTYRSPGTYPSETDEKVLRHNVSLNREWDYPDRRKACFTELR